MKQILFFLIGFMPIMVVAQHKAAYVIYDTNGKVTDYAQLLEKSSKTDVVFFGELHDNPIAHWLELQLTKDLYSEKEANLILGAEMLESDNQLILDEYLSGRIDVKKFEDEARLWKNYKTDYKPLVDFAKENHLPFIATNIPRRYASVVFKKGLIALDSLSPEAKEYIAPLPVEIDLEIPSYKKLLEMAGGHGGENFPHAQAIKDATMAHFIHQNWSKKKLFLHYNGSFHSDDKQGILWFLNRLNRKIKTVTISTVLQKNIGTLEDEYLGKADFIICIPEDMTRTY